MSEKWTDLFYKLKNKSDPGTDLFFGTKGINTFIVNFNKSVPLFSPRGHYASEEGAALGGGKIHEKFSFSFPATKEGLKEILRGLHQ